MTIQDVKDRLEWIKVESLHDSEAAHSSEDALHADVLEAIANGTAEDPCAMARLAISTQEIDFERWYS